MGFNGGFFFGSGICGSSGEGFTYYDTEYKTYAPNCILKGPSSTDASSYAGIMATSQYAVADQRIYVVLKESSYTNSLFREQQLLQLTFPPNFFRDEINYFPKQGNTAGSVTVNFYGYKLTAGSKVRFLKAGQPPITAPDSLLRYPEPYRIEAIFNLRNKTIGSWDIEITTPLGERILVPNGFTINPPLPPTIRVRLNVPTLT